MGHVALYRVIEIIIFKTAFCIYSGYLSHVKIYLTSWKHLSASYQEGNFFYGTVTLLQMYSPLHFAHILSFRVEFLAVAEAKEKTKHRNNSKRVL